MPRPSLRNSCILGLVAAGTVLAAFGGWRYAKASAPVSGPIVLVSIDGLSAGRLSSYGATDGVTPAIDQLAQDGVVFERAYSHAPLTLPSHVSLLTGRLPFQTTVRNNVGVAVPSSERLLQEVLRDRGYLTAGVVSTAELDRSTGIGRGFTIFDDTLPERTSAMTGWPAHRAGTDAAEVAEHWLESARTPRAFLFVHLADLRAPGASLAGGNGEGLRAIDAAVDRLVRYLKQHQAYDQSTVVIVGAHGAAGGAGGGLIPHEGVLRVPLIVKRPAGESAGRRVHTLVQLADIAPTILDLAKAPVPGNTHGRSLKPLLDGARTEWARLVYSESAYGYYQFSWPPAMSITDGRYRYASGLDEGLYDLERDHLGSTRIADADASRPLAAALETLVKNSRLLAPTLPVEAAQRDRLEALGNVVGLHPDESRTATPSPAPDAPTAIVNDITGAVAAAYDGRWRQAVAQLRPVLLDHPELADGWRLLIRLAQPAGRPDVALDAARRLAARPEDAQGRLDLATVLFDSRRWNEARVAASEAAELAGDRLPAVAGAAFELLARTALAEKAADDAKRLAARAETYEPGRPVTALIDCRLAFDAAAYEQAADVCARGAARASAAERRPVRDLQWLAGESLLHLERHAEAEQAFQDELTQFPLSVQARVGMATVYHRTGRTDEAREEIAALTRITSSTEANQASTRFWAMVGDPAAVNRARPTAAH